MSADRPTDSVRLDLCRFRRLLVQYELESAINTLKYPHVGRGVLSLVVNYAAMFLATLACLSISFWLYPLALVIVANRQLAMNNLLHDASHLNLLPKRRLSDTVATVFLAAPLLTSVRRYREQHFEHHKYLGIPDKDYDYIDNRDNRNWQSTLIRLIFDRNRWLTGMLHDFPTLLISEKIIICVWWLCISIMLLRISSEMLILTITLWWIARSTLVHVIGAFALMMDHYGLVIGPPSTYTRNVLGNYIFHIILQPMDGLHLVHHLFPDVPYFNTRRAHNVLLAIPEYGELCHCNGYFAGNRSLLNSWMKMPISIK